MSEIEEHEDKGRVESEYWRTAFQYYIAARFATILPKARPKGEKVMRFVAAALGRVDGFFIDE